MSQKHDRTRLRQASEPDRQEERRPRVGEQRMAELREGLGMKVIAIMVQRFGVLELWDLNRVSDMGAGRGMFCGGGLTKASFKSITSNGRYRIVNLTIRKDFHLKVKLPSTLRRL